MFKKILISNRGEIALRAVRECKELGVRAAVVYSDVDQEAPFVKYADERYPLGNPDAVESYLNIDKIIDIAKRCGAEAIYPGYGFLAENPKFIEACAANGLIFIGPPRAAVEKVKPKHKACELMKNNGIPVIPEIGKVVENPKDIAETIEAVERIGYPVMVKPSGAGGGIGMKIVYNGAELEKAMSYAQSVGSSAFGIATFYIERYIQKAKHIEFQILADKYGNVIHLGERECSVQRRFQKLIEESPSPVMTPELKEKMGATAIKIAKLIDYVNALTVEFLYSTETGEYFFCEVNTRLQVEHPITELITGVNIVKEQIKLAAGEKLGYTQDAIQPRGWAIECRINAEDALSNFFPSPGKITAYNPPTGFGVRLDSGVCAGYTVPYHYDSLLAKLVTWGRNRKEAIACMKRALDEFVIGGIKTNIPFHKVALDDESFIRGDYATTLIDDRKIMEKLQTPTGSDGLAGSQAIK